MVQKIFLFLFFVPNTDTRSVGCNEYLVTRIFFVPNEHFIRLLRIFHIRHFLVNKGHFYSYKEFLWSISKKIHKRVFIFVLGPFSILVKHVYKESLLIMHYQ